MKTEQSHFRKHFFLYILALSIIVIGVFSYFRFIVNNDYIVEYEGACDPTMEKCFVGCEDDSCTKEYYYSSVQKYVPDLYRECGKDITDCEAASICLPEDLKCSVTYCDSEADGNDACYTEQSNAQSADPTDKSLQDNNTNNTNI